MKKTLVALAALASMSAFAQSSVTIYGQFDSGVYSVKNLNPGERGTVYGDGATFSPIIGFKGLEDLGGGLKAGFDLQSDVQSNNGGQNQNGLFRRQANSSIESAELGQIKLGVTTNPIIATNSALMPTGANGNSVSTVTSTALGYADFYTKNAVTYTTPAIMGLTGQVQKGLSNDTAAAENGSMSAWSLAYVNGPLEARYAGQNRKAATAAIAATAPNGGTAATYDKKSSVLGLKYTMGPVSAGFARMTSDGQLGYTYNGITKNGATSVKERTANQAGVAYTTGAWIFGATMTKAQESKLTNLQARYALSKRTNLIGSYGQANNKGANVGFSPVAFNTGSAPSTILDGNALVTKDQKASALGIALTHSF